MAAETKDDVKMPPTYNESEAPQPYPQTGYPPQSYAGQGQMPSGYTMQQPVMMPPGGGIYYAPQVQPYTGPPIDDYCTFSIINMIFCCFWIGLVALLKSNSVREAKTRGDYQTAQRLSSEALKWNKIALGLGIVFTIVYAAAVSVYILFIVGYFNTW